LNLLAGGSSSSPGGSRLTDKNARVALEMKILKYRALARDAADALTIERIAILVAELEQKRREIDQ
jgi:hypothetical protein